MTLRSVVAAIAALVSLPATAAAAGPVDLRVALGAGAQLGGQAPLTFELTVDERRLPVPVTEIRLLAPSGIGLGDLGVATCRVAPSSLLEVLVPSFPQIRCPRNAVIGRGTATAALLFDPELPAIRGAATIALYSGEVQDGRPGLLVVAQTYNPVTTQMTYAGRLRPRRRPFGLELALQVRPPATPPFGADIALTRMRMTIGGTDLRYVMPSRGGQRSYRPGGVALPLRCPRGGLAFRAELRFADGRRHAVDNALPCPRAPRRG